jgi:hypothetical protein
MNFRNIDIYCERLDASFWAEPVNAISNLSIFLAGCIGLYLIKQIPSGQMKRHTFMCSLMAVLTGLGSFTFHTFANSLTMWMDIIPITFFQIFIINFYLQFMFKKSVKFRAVFLTLFVCGSIGLIFKPFSLYLNGSLTYFPSFITLGVFGFLLNRMNQMLVSKYTLMGTVIFVISLNARSFDMAVCPSFPLGTHFIWHSLNGGLILSLLLAVITFSRNTLKKRCNWLK